jgi:WD40 repeat protein
MNKKVRNILFFTLVAIFLIAAPFFILHSQGYRIDFENKKLTQTGALFFKIEPGRSEVLISKDKLKKTSFLFHSALIENLVPKKYNIEVLKEGYFSWSKELEVKAKTVTESKGIVLIPKNPEITIASKGTQQIWELPDKRNYILLDEERENSWALKTYDIEKRLKTYLVKETDFDSTEAQFLDLKVSSNGKKIVLKVGVHEQIRYYLLEIDNPLEPVLLTFFNSDITKIAFDPSNDEYIIYTKNNILFKYDTEKQQYFPILNKENQFIPNIVSYEIVHNDIYFLNSSGILTKTNSSFNSFEELNEEELLIKKETPYSIKIFNDFIFVVENKKAFLLNKEKKAFEVFFDGLEYLKPSPDYTKLAYGSTHEMWFMYLQEAYEGSKKNPRDKEFLVRTSKDIKGLTWLNSSYIAYNENETIKITETDTRDKLNIVEIAQIENLELLWNEVKKELLILSSSNLSLFSYPLF